MGALKPGMTHAEAAGHLRQEVIGTLRHETGSLVDEAKFFGAVRAIMCDIDYVAALSAGWDGQDPRRISTNGEVSDFRGECFPRQLRARRLGAPGLIDNRVCLAEYPVP
jgi:hypothetical protein